MLKSHIKYKEYNKTFLQVAQPLGQTEHVFQAQSLNTTFTKLLYFLFFLSYFCRDKQIFDISAMGFCSYLNCNSSSRHTSVSLFGFPKDKSKRQRWCKLIKRQHRRDNCDAQKAKLCHKHFRGSDFICGWGSGRKRRLREGAELANSISSQGT